MDNPNHFRSKFPPKADLEAYEVFHQELTAYLKEYSKVLKVKYTSGTITKHVCVLHDFIELVTYYKGCTDLGQVTKAMTASRLAAYIKSHGDEAYSTITVKNIVSSFLEFIFNKYGIRNPKLTHNHK